MSTTAIKVYSGRRRNKWLPAGSLLVMRVGKLALRALGMVLIATIAVAAATSAAQAYPPDFDGKYKPPWATKLISYSPPDAPPGKLYCVESFPFYDFCTELTVKDPRNGTSLITKAVPPEELSPQEADPSNRLFAGTDSQGNKVKVLYIKDSSQTKFTEHRRFIVNNKVSKKELYNNFTSYWPDKFTAQEHLIKSHQGAELTIDHTYFFKSGTKKEVEYGEYKEKADIAVPTLEYTAKYYADTDILKSKVASYFQEGFRVHRLISNYSSAGNKTKRTVNYYKVIDYKGDPNIAVLPYKEDAVSYSGGEPTKIVTTWIDPKTGDPTAVQPTTTYCNTSPAKCKEWQYTVE